MEDKIKTYFIVLIVGLSILVGVNQVQGATYNITVSWEGTIMNHSQYEGVSMEVRLFQGGSCRTGSYWDSTNVVYVESSPDYQEFPSPVQIILNGADSDYWCVVIYNANNGNQLSVPGYAAGTGTDSFELTNGVSLPSVLTWYVSVTIQSVGGGGGWI